MKKTRRVPAQKTKDAGLRSPAPDGIAAGTQIAKPVPGLKLSGRARDYVAQAAGYIHAVAHDLDLMTSGLMTAGSRKALAERILDEEEMVNEAAGALTFAIQRIEEEHDEEQRKVKN